MLYGHRLWVANPVLIIAFEAPAGGGACAAALKLRLGAHSNEALFDAMQGIEHFEEHPTRQAVIFLPDFFRGAYMTEVWNV